MHRTLGAPIASAMTTWSPDVPAVVSVASTAERRTRRRPGNRARNPEPFGHFAFYARESGGRSLSISMAP